MAEIKSVSVLIPTYKEAENIGELVKGVIEVLNACAVDYEILVIDDGSVDRTAEIAESQLCGHGRVIRRVVREKSLSLSVLDGMSEARGDVLIVMDADGSHPPELIPFFLRELRAGYDLVIASRYISGGSSKGFTFSRAVISRFACFLGKMVTSVKDNTSGFFCLRKCILQGVNLTPRGYKIGLEVIVKSKAGSIKEIPYTYIFRKKGKSKLGVGAIWLYLCQIGSLLRYNRLNGNTGVVLTC